MSGPPVSRVGDTGYHGAPGVKAGVLVQGSPTFTAEGIAVSRVGDTYNCSFHGPNPMQTGSPTLSADGKAVVRVGDKATCGAQLGTGSPSLSSN